MWICGLTYVDMWIRGLTYVDMWIGCADLGSISQTMLPVKGLTTVFLCANIKTCVMDSRHSTTNKEVGTIFATTYFQLLIFILAWFLHEQNRNCVKSGYVLRMGCEGWV